MMLCDGVLFRMLYDVTSILYYYYVFDIPFFKQMHWKRILLRHFKCIVYKVWLWTTGRGNVPRRVLVLCYDASVSFLRFAYLFRTHSFFFLPSFLVPPSRYSSLNGQQLSYKSNSPFKHIYETKRFSGVKSFPTLVCI